MTIDGISYLVIFSCKVILYVWSSLPYSVSDEYPGLFDLYFG